MINIFAILILSLTSLPIEGFAIPAGKRIAGIVCSDLSRIPDSNNVRQLNLQIEIKEVYYGNYSLIKTNFIEGSTQEVLAENLNCLFSWNGLATCENNVLTVKIKAVQTAELKDVFIHTHSMLEIADLRSPRSESYFFWQNIPEAGVDGCQVKEVFTGKF